MNRLNSASWFWMLIGALMMDAVAWLTICSKGLDWPNGLFALTAIACTLAFYKYYKEEENNG